MRWWGFLGVFIGALSGSIAGAADCTVATAIPADAAKDFAQQWYLASDFSTQVVFAGESKTVWVAVRPLSTSPQTLRVHLLTKRRDADAFTEACSTPSDSFEHNDARLIGFSLPEPAVRWRIQIDQFGPPVGLGLIVFSSVQPETDAGRGRASIEGVLDFVCVDDKNPRLKAALGRLKPSFLERDYVVVINDSDVEISDAQLAAMQEEFTRALEAWHFASKLPQLGGLTIVFRSAKGDRVLVNARLVQFLRARGVPKYDPKNYVSAAFYVDLDMDLALTTIRRLRTSDAVDGVTYQPVEETGIERENLCSVPPGILRPPLDSVQAAFGCSARRADLPVEITLSLVNGATQCGNPSTTFACEQSNAVELDVRDFAFQQHGTGKTILGDGDTPIDLRFLFLHELGHRLGLEHTADGVMARYPRDSSCVTPDLIKGIADAQSKGQKRR
jgi:hypothetical protein